MNFISSLLVAVSLISTQNSGNRYLILPDPYDTDYWYDAQSLSSDVAYQAIFKDQNDDDYYIYTASNLRSVAVIVDSPSQNASISLFKNNTSDRVAHYYSNLTFDYSSFSGNLVSLQPNETLYIQVIASNTASSYSITVITNPNLSGTSILKYNEIAPTKYYGSTNLSQIKFFIDASCSTPIGSLYSFSDAYLYAINQWNKVGNLSLSVVNNLSNADVVLKTDTVLALYPDIGKTYYNFIPYPYSNGPYYNFIASEIKVVDNWTLYETNSDAAFIKIIGTCFHEIGHSLGLAHASYTKNLMYSNSNQIYLDPLTEIGDGDVASYLSIYN